MNVQVQAEAHSIPWLVFRLSLNLALIELTPGAQPAHTRAADLIVIHPLTAFKPRSGSTSYRVHKRAKSRP